MSALVGVLGLVALGAVPALVFRVTTGVDPLSPLLSALGGLVTGGGLLGAIVGIGKQTMENARVQLDQRPPVMTASSRP